MGTGVHTRMGEWENELLSPKDYQQFLAALPPNQCQRQVKIPKLML